MTRTDLSKGQNVQLLVEGEPVTATRLTVQWVADEPVDVDVSALLIGQDGRVRTDADFVFYNQPEAEDGAVRLLGKAQDEDQASDRLLVNLTDLPDEVSVVVALASVDAAEHAGFATVRGLSLSVATADEREVARFTVPTLGAETAVVVGEVYRRDGGWRFRAVGQGYAAGLAGVAADYGITVDDAVEEAPPAQAVTPTADDDVVDAGAADGTVLIDLTASQAGVPVADQVALPLAPAVAARVQPRAAVRTKKRVQQVTPVRALTLGDDDSWRAARLFPVVGIGGAAEQERRATSALLAVLMGVREFGRAVTARLGAPAGSLET